MRNASQMQCKVRSRTTSFTGMNLKLAARGVATYSEADGVGGAVVRPARWQRHVNLNRGPGLPGDVAPLVLARMLALINPLKALHQGHA